MDLDKESIVSAAKEMMDEMGLMARKGPIAFTIALGVVAICATALSIVFLMREEPITVSKLDKILEKYSQADTAITKKEFGEVLRERDRELSPATERAVSELTSHLKSLESVVKNEEKNASLHRQELKDAVKETQVMVKEQGNVILRILERLPPAK